MHQLTDTRVSGGARFRFGGQIGAGGAGVVYDGFDAERNERIALKGLRSPAPDTLLSLKNEFRRVQGIQHENLVMLHELVELEGRWFIAMEYVEGTAFLSYVRRS